VHSHFQWFIDSISHLLMLYNQPRSLYNAGMISADRKLRQFWEFTRKVIQHADRDKVFILASSVVYSTLISLVPFIAFIVSLLSVFGGLTTVEGYVQEFLRVNFGAAAETGFIDLVEGFVSNAGNLGVIGLISFLITSIFLLNRVWVTLNQIYRTSSAGGNMLVRFGRFLTVLVIGTLMLSAYVSIMTYVRGYFLVNEEITQLMNVLRVAAPWFFMFLTLFLLIFWVPSAKVKKLSAAIGALWGMVLFRVSNSIFTAFVNVAINFSIIYGSFATILIFLLWVYLVWVIIFLAAEVSYVHQYKPEHLKYADIPDPPMEQIAQGIDVLAAIAEHYSSGKGAMSTRELSARLRIPGQKLYTYLDLLEHRGFVIHLDKGGHSYIPAKPLEDLHLGDILPELCGTRVHKEKRATPGSRLAGMIFADGITSLNQLDVTQLLEAAEKIPGTKPDSRQKSKMSGQSNPGNAEKLPNKSRKKDPPRKS